MIVDLCRKEALALLEADNFRALNVQAPEGMSNAELQARIGTLGRIEDGHVWLSIDALKDRGPASAEWTSGYENMIAYAERAGWVSSDRTSVRAHIVLKAA